MRSMFAMLFVLAMAAPSAALAQECDPSDDSQMCLTYRAGGEYKTEDEKLNKAYSETIKRLSGSPEDRKLLQTSQRAWIAFRDAECTFANSHSEGGSIHPMLVLMCMTGLTKARTEQLGGYLNCEEGDMSCPVPPAQ